MKCVPAKKRRKTRKREMKNEMKKHDNNNNNRRNQRTTNGGEILKRLLNVNFVVSSRIIYVQITLQAVFISCCSSVVGLFFFSPLLCCVVECNGVHEHGTNEEWKKRANQVNLSVCVFYAGKQWTAIENRTDQPGNGERKKKTKFRLNGRKWMQRTEEYIVRMLEF